MRQPKACPFCGVQLKYTEHVCRTIPGTPTMKLWRHVKNGCFLACAEITPDEIPAWDCRADAPDSPNYSWLIKDLRITADGLPNKFSQNDELFQVLYDAADAIEKLTGTAK